jgi:hypothetical protein
MCKSHGISISTRVFFGCFTDIGNLANVLGRKLVGTFRMSLDFHQISLPTYDSSHFIPKNIHFAFQEWVMALNFLEAWRAEIPRRRPAEASSGAAAQQLPQEAEELIETWRCRENLDLGNGKHLFLWIFLDMNPRFGVEHGDKPLFGGSCMLLLSIPKWTILAKEVEV